MKRNSTMIIKTSGVTDANCDIVPTLLFVQGEIVTVQTPINKLKKYSNYVILFIIMPSLVYYILRFIFNISIE